jgi:hypothetical protein
VDEADKAHDSWVGAEPLSTQYAAEQTFTTTRFNKELSGAYKHHYPLGNPYSARLRVPPQQVGKAQTTDIVANRKETKRSRLQPAANRAPTASPAQSREELSEVRKGARRPLRHRGSNPIELLLLNSKQFFYLQ